MKNILYLAFLGFTLFTISCSDNDPDTAESSSCNEVFFSSFENGEDFTSFEGYGYYRTDDVPAAAGDSSLVVCGGCIGPHLYFDVGPFDKDKELSLDFMARVEQYESSLSLYIVGGTDNNMHLTVSDTLWTHYQPIETLFLPADEVARVEFFSGGIAALNTYYDLFTICEEI